MSLTNHKPAMGRVAGGNHLAAGNDEPEPMECGDLTQADLEEIDAQYHIAKTSGALRRRDDRRAVELQEQVQAWRNNGGM